MSKTTNTKKKSFIFDYQKVMQHFENVNFALPALEIQKGQVPIKIPKRFSISEKPKKTIYLLRWLYTVSMRDSVDRIIFDYSECEFLGLSASTIMDIILLVAVEYRAKIEKPLKLSGNFPRNKMVRDVFLASGLPYHINARYKVEYDKDNVEKFEIVSGECSNDVRQSGIIATELTEYYNRCLRHQKLKLRDEGILLLATLLGEVLGNCEIHGGEHATWYTQGHYFFSEKWSEEMAYTVFALQEGISRLRDKDIEGYEGRGTGTVTLIETLNLIGRTDAGNDYYIGPDIY